RPQLPGAQQRQPRGAAGAARSRSLSCVRPETRCRRPRANLRGHGQRAGGSVRGARLQRHDVRAPGARLELSHQQPLLGRCHRPEPQGSARHPGRPPGAARARPDRAHLQSPWMVLARRLRARRRHALRGGRRQAARVACRGTALGPRPVRGRRHFEPGRFGPRGARAAAAPASARLRARPGRHLRPHHARGTGGVSDQPGAQTDGRRGRRNQGCSRRARRAGRHPAPWFERSVGANLASVPPGSELRAGGPRRRQVRSEDASRDPRLSSRARAGAGRGGRTQDARRGRSARARHAQRAGRSDQYAAPHAEQRAHRRYHPTGLAPASPESAKTHRYRAPIHERRRGAGGQARVALRRPARQAQGTLGVRARGLRASTGQSDMNHHLELAKQSHPAAIEQRAQGSPPLSRHWRSRLNRGFVAATRSFRLLGIWAWGFLTLGFFYLPLSVHAGWPLHAELSGVTRGLFVGLTPGDVALCATAIFAAALSWFFVMSLVVDGAEWVLVEQLGLAPARPNPRRAEYSAEALDSRSGRAWYRGHPVYPRPRARELPAFAQDLFTAPLSPLAMLLALGLALPGMLTVIVPADDNPLAALGCSVLLGVSLWLVTS